MSMTISLHTRSKSLIAYVEDVLYPGSPDYQKYTIDAIEELWPRFNYDLKEPTNLALIETMCYLSTAYTEGYDDDEIIHHIMDEVDEIYTKEGEQLLDSELPFQFYLLGTALFDFLAEDMEIYELHEYDLSMILIKRDRVDLTFY